MMLCVEKDLLIKIVGLAIVCILASISSRGVYNLYLHPLRKFPGPKAWCMFRFPMLRCMLDGRLPFRVKSLHDKYGPVVRVAPDELSLVQPEAWKDIYQQREMDRPSQWRGKYPGATADNLISARSRDHMRLRKVFSPAFSEKAVAEYEPTVHKHLEIFISKMKAKTMRTACDVDLTRWFNFLLYDTIMEIGWGTTFDLMGRENYNPWVTAMHGYEERMLGVCLNYYPLLRYLTGLAVPKSVSNALRMIRSVATDNVTTRLEAKNDKPDIIGNALGPALSLEEVGLTRDELDLCSMTFVVVGSEPVTSALAAAINHLLQPSGQSHLDRLVQEIRQRFSTASDISAASTQSLPYLNAVLTETLRLSPPIPDSLRRQIPKGGLSVGGSFVPEGAICSVACWSVFRSVSNFESPLAFAPERWLNRDSSRLARLSEGFRHNPKAFSPFSCGSRGCIGRALAWMEMRIILARLLFEFDVGVPEGQKLHRWDEQRILWEWERTPMNVQLSER